MFGGGGGRSSDIPLFFVLSIISVFLCWPHQSSISSWFGYYTVVEWYSMGIQIVFWWSGLIPLTAGQRIPPKKCKNERYNMGEWGGMGHLALFTEMKGF